MANECNQCGRFLEPVDLLCEKCWDRVFLANHFCPIERAHRFEHPVWALWRWTDSRHFLVDHKTLNSKDIAWLVYQLKGGRYPLASYRLCQMFLQRLRGSSGIIDRQVGTPIFVPAPFERGSGPDHATRLAHHFSAMTGFPILNCLQRADTGAAQEQKTKRKKDRAFNRLVLNSAGPASQSNVIFVDDIVTTGSTAQAAFIALGKPKQFSVWSIAIRS